MAVQAGGRKRVEAVRIGLCLEQTLGHRTHSLNLIEAAHHASLDIQLVSVEYSDRKSVPLPWAVRGSIDACRQLRRLAPTDVTLFHTQSIGLLAPLATGGRPYVVSLDATPAQIDEMAGWYSHGRHARGVETVKRGLYRRVLGGAAGVIAWSDWARDSLVSDYAVDPERVSVVHPGAGSAFFEIERQQPNAVPRILFVGGDFYRKGGDLLLDVFRQMQGRALLTLVTTADVGSLPPGVTVVSDATPGSRRLAECYAAADIFCLPTRADATALVVSEAMAAGLAVITTNVGGVAEAVVDGESGLVVTPDSEPELAEALFRLLDDSAMLERLQRQARSRARQSLDARANAGRIFQLLTEVA
jgi:glycosyltransferase involved in cell wall biosynthesis